MKVNNPVISVVTVAFNAASVLDKTLKSVTGQRDASFEYLVIDGGSSDGTQDIVRRYGASVNHFVSERDGGIYFGMNKGVAAASGEYLIFMNAGDVFADCHVLSDVECFLKSHPEASVVYGDSEQLFEYGSYIVRPDTAYFNHRMAISHQASFVRASLLRQHPFDTAYRYAADFEQLSSLYLSGETFLHIDRLIARVEMDGGATYSHFEESANEMYDIIAKRGVDVSSERKSAIRRKRLVRIVKFALPGFFRRPLFRIIAKHYKAL